MDIGALAAAALWKGKGKGKGKGRGKRKGKKGKERSRPETEISIGELYERKRKRKRKRKTDFYLYFGFAGRVVRQGTLRATALTIVFQLLKVKNFTRRMTQEIGLTLVRTIGPSGPSGRLTR